MSRWQIGVITALVASAAWGSPPVGASMEAALHGADGRRVALSQWRGKPVVLFYEDRDSTQQNARVKEELFARGQALGLLEAASVVAVADLEGFNFFPAREFALAFVQQEEKKLGVPILVDLEGRMGEEPWRLPRHKSNVLLLDAQGRVVWHHAGRMGEQEVETFFRRLGVLLGRDIAPEPQP
jgi:hypothetical protein